MEHNMIIKGSPEVNYKPFFASCSCGPQGNFATKTEAYQFLHAHAGHVAAGVNTVTFKDLTGEEEPAKEEPEEQEEEVEKEKEGEGKGQEQVKVARRVRRGGGKAD